MCQRDELDGEKCGFFHCFNAVCSMTTTALQALPGIDAAPKVIKADSSIGDTIDEMWRQCAESVARIIRNKARYLIVEPNLMNVIAHQGRRSTRYVSAIAGALKVVVEAVLLANPGLARAGCRPAMARRSVCLKSTPPRRYRRP